MVAVFHADGIGEPTASLVAGHNRRIIGVSGEHSLATYPIGVSNHAEQGVLAVGPIDGPTGVKNFVPTMFRVGLSEHHQLNIAGIPSQFGKCCHQIIDFIGGQRETEGHVGAGQGVAPSRQNRHRGEAWRRGRGKKSHRLLRVRQHGLNHPVMKRCVHSRRISAGNVLKTFNSVDGPPLYAIHRVKPAVTSYIGCFTGPWGNGAQTGHHDPTGCRREMSINRRGQCSGL